MYNPKITLNDIFPPIPISIEESKAMTKLDDAVGITTIQTELNIVEGEELKRAVASELLVPDPEEVSEANNEATKGS